MGEYSPLQAEIEYRRLVRTCATTLASFQMASIRLEVVSEQTKAISNELARKTSNNGDVKK